MTTETKLAVLKGSEKQVTWATEIRAGHLAAIERDIAAIEQEAADYGDPLNDLDLRKIRRLKVAAYMLRTIPDAAAIINSRNHHESILPLLSPSTFERWAKAAGV